MKTSFNLCLWAIACLFTPFMCMAQQHQITIDHLLHKQFPINGPGGVVLVAKADQIIYHKAFGQAELEHQVPMPLDGVFRLGSNTKQFTAVAILKLAEEGKLSLQDDIQKFIPDYPNHGKKISIENLLTHTSGIKNYTGLSTWTESVKRSDLSPKQLVELFKNEPLDFEPGTAYRYCNSGYVLLGYIIELVSGQSYADYISQKFFKPLGMSNSFYDKAAPIIPNRVAGYLSRNGKNEHAAFLSMSLPYAAGSLLSSTNDILKWYNALADHKVISQTSLLGAQRSHVLPNGKPTGYGYGWEIGNVQGHAAIKHVGVVNGFVTYISYLPSEKILVVVLSNFEGIGDLDIPASKIAATLLGQPYAETPIGMDPQKMASYTGLYQNENGEQKSIVQQDGQLVYFSKGGNKAILVPIATDKFRVGNSLVYLQATRAKKGEPIGFVALGTGLTSAFNQVAKVATQLKSIVVASQVLDQYVGRYLFAPNQVFEVVKENNKLYGKVGQDKKELMPFAPHQFFAKDIDATLVFKLAENGTVSGLTKIQNSNMEAQRIN